MENKGFFGGLFDLSFSEFITTRIIKVLFVLAIVLSGCGALGILFSGLARGVGTGVLSLVLAPVAFILYVLGARIWLEIIIVLFRIAENTGKLVELGQGKSQSSADES